MHPGWANATRPRSRLSGANRVTDHLGVPFPGAGAPKRLAAAVGTAGLCQRRGSRRRAETTEGGRWGPLTAPPPDAPGGLRRRRRGDLPVAPSELRSGDPTFSPGRRHLSLALLVVRRLVLIARLPEDGGVSGDVLLLLRCALLSPVRIPAAPDPPVHQRALVSTVPSAALSLALGMGLRVEAKYESASPPAAAPAPLAAPGPWSHSP